MLTAEPAWAGRLNIPHGTGETTVPDESNKQARVASYERKSDLDFTLPGTGTWVLQRGLTSRGPASTDRPSAGLTPCFIRFGFPEPVLHDHTPGGTNRRITGLGKYRLDGSAGWLQSPTNYPPWLADTLSSIANDGVPGTRNSFFKFTEGSFCCPLNLRHFCKDNWSAWLVLLNRASSPMLPRQSRTRRPFAPKADAENGDSLMNFVGELLGRDVTSIKVRLHLFTSSFNATARKPSTIFNS